MGHGRQLLISPDAESPLARCASPNNGCTAEPAQPHRGLTKPPGAHLFLLPTVAAHLDCGDMQHSGELGQDEAQHAVTPCFFSRLRDILLTTGLGTQAAELGDEQRRRMMRAREGTKGAGSRGRAGEGGRARGARAALVQPAMRATSVRRLASACKSGFSRGQRESGSTVDVFDSPPVPARPGRQQASLGNQRGSTPSPENPCSLTSRSSSSRSRPGTTPGAVCSTCVQGRTLVQLGLRVALEKLNVQ